MKFALRENINVESFSDGEMVVYDQETERIHTLNVTAALALETILNENGDPIDDGVSNKGIVEKLLALKSDVNMFRQGTPAAFLQSIVSEIGVVTSNAKTLSENQKNIVSSISEMKLSESGVDLDEEGMDLIRYQRAYELASKVFNVMNEIYQKLINETGV